MIEERHHYILRRKDGAYMNYFFERVKYMRSAARFDDEDAFQQWINGHYKPADPDNYEIVPMVVTYEVQEVPHGTAEKLVPEDQCSDAGHSILAEG